MLLIMFRSAHLSNSQAIQRLYADVRALTALGGGPLFHLSESEGEAFLALGTHRLSEALRALAERGFTVLSRSGRTVALVDPFGLLLEVHNFAQEEADRTAGPAVDPAPPR